MIRRSRIDHVGDRNGIKEVEFIEGKREVGSSLYQSKTTVEDKMK